MEEECEVLGPQCVVMQLFLPCSMLAATPKASWGHGDTRPSQQKALAGNTSAFHGSQGNERMLNRVGFRTEQDVIYTLKMASLGVLEPSFTIRFLSLVIPERG